VIPSVSIGVGRFACRRALAERLVAAYMFSLRAAWCVGLSIPGALSILKGAVPARARGSGYTAPTYAVGFPGSSMSDGQGGSHPSDLWHIPDEVQ
jgi:hypothetical protein